MIIYTATNTKTGKFYIGSAKNYCRYMARVGTHHISKCGYPFQTDLQADPGSFKWEWFEDGRNDRNTEQSLIDCFWGSPFLYNIGSKYERTDKHRGWNHSDKTIQKMRETALKTSSKRSATLSKVVNTKEPCPHCGKLMNPGNLKQHLRAQTCLKNQG